MLEMNNTPNLEREVFLIKIVQSGENIAIPLTDKNLKRQFKEIYYSIIKEFRFKQKDVYISNEEGMMIGNTDLSLTLQDIIKKFGTTLKLYYEGII